MHLEKHRFQEIGSLQPSSVGFIPNPVTGELVAPVPRGYVITLRLDEKLLPTQVVNTEVGEKVKQIEESTGRHVGRKERRAIKEEVLHTLLPKAFTKTRHITAYYHIDGQHLIVDTRNEKHASLMMACLRESMGSIKSTTIHISSIKQGLSTRLTNWLNDGAAPFEGFEVGEYCRMVKNEEGKKTITIQGATVDEFGDDTRDALSIGFQVDTLLLSRDGVEFKLNDKFQLTSIGFEEDLFIDIEEEEDREHYYRHEVSIKLILLHNVIHHLCDLFDYKPGAEERQ